MLASPNRDRDDVLVAEGVVVAVHKSDLYRVEVRAGESTRTVLAKRSGKAYRAGVVIVLGDRVRLEISAYDPGRGRIVWRA